VAAEFSAVGSGMAEEFGRKGLDIGKAIIVIDNIALTI
jgi:hypothetical protein